MYYDKKYIATNYNFKEFISFILISFSSPVFISFNLNLFCAISSSPTTIT